MRSKTLDPTRTGQEAEALEVGLRSRIIGQEDAIRQVVETYETYTSGLSFPGRPIANLMFLGPTGSGKTRLVEAIAECLLQNPKAVIKSTAPNSSIATKSQSSSALLRDTSVTARQSHC